MIEYWDANIESLRSPELSDEVLSSPLLTTTLRQTGGLGATIDLTCIGLLCTIAFSGSRTRTSDTPIMSS
ncbi:hypothetical protein TNCV_1806101 [Trichonephila clavipes]|nr:hypothetical protein TNCV_1806101 [Trichonephila clavipes]